MNKHDSFKNITMKQTIEQLREQACKLSLSERLCYSESEKMSYVAGYEDGAEWEYNRTKWIDVDNGLPTLKGWYLVRVCVSCDPQLLFYDADKLHYAWSEVITWAEIPL